MDEWLKISVTFVAVIFSSLLLGFAAAVLDILEENDDEH